MCIYIAPTFSCVSLRIIYLFPFFSFFYLFLSLSPTAACFRSSITVYNCISLILLIYHQIWDGSVSPWIGDRSVLNQFFLLFLLFLLLIIHWITQFTFTLHARYGKGQHSPRAGCNARSPVPRYHPPGDYFKSYLAKGLFFLPLR